VQTGTFSPNFFKSSGSNQISSNFIQIQTIEIFSDFLFKIHFGFEEVPIRKVVPYFNPFTTIFYLKCFEQGKTNFQSKQVWWHFEKK
jgi:hypothetical protein